MRAVYESRAGHGSRAHQLVLVSQPLKGHSSLAPEPLAKWNMTHLLISNVGKAVS